MELLIDDAKKIQIAMKTMVMQKAPISTAARKKLENPQDASEMVE